MADWNWGQILFQALITGIVFAAVQEFIRWLHRRKNKGKDDQE